ncbi:T9SS type A sorting domain-containing protein [Hymenobacter sp. B81]|uniref:T9SS type A sorting domain-containing protein n=1 Tax=Hymenobacter sp. B81 TaxID=3344878 RepID=UPI0037DCB695
MPTSDALARRALLLLGLGLSTRATQAQLVTFSFANASGAEVQLPPDAQPAGALVAPMTRGPGVAVSLASNSISATGWTLAAAPDTADYFALRLQPLAAARLRLDSLRFDERRSGSGIRAWALRSSLDGFSADLAAAPVPDNTDTRTDWQVALPAAFASLAGPVEFRLYGYGAEQGSGTWRLHNVRLYGAVRLASASRQAAAPQLAVYPLPAGPHLTVSSPAAGIMTVFDAQGRAVLRAPVLAQQPLRLDVRHWPAGLYVLQLQLRESRSTQRFNKL